MKIVLLPSRFAQFIQTYENTSHVT